MDNRFLTALTSVEACWHQRISYPKFKESSWRHASAYYREVGKQRAIIRNNHSYLLENIQLPCDLISRMRSEKVDCLSDIQARLLRRHQNPNVGNAKEPTSINKGNVEQLLHIIRSVEDEKASAFVQCLRETKQKTVARVVKNGGAVMQVHLTGFESIRMMSLNEDFAEKVNSLKDKNKLRSPKQNKFIGELKSDEIHILSSCSDRQAKIWIWCKSLEAMEKLQKFNDSKQLLKILMKIPGKWICPAAVNVEKLDFRKTVAVRSIHSVCFNAELKIKENMSVFGVTTLQNKIYLLFLSHASDSNCISISENENPFYLPKKISIREIENPHDITSSEKENCLYVSGGGKNDRSIWKIKETGDGVYHMTRWLMNIDSDEPLTLSVSCEGQLLISSKKGQSNSLSIYGPDADLSHCIQLPNVFNDHFLSHAIETAEGNFIVSHLWMEESESSAIEKEKEKEEKDEKKEQEEKESKSNAIHRWGISEVTRDGKMITRQFIPRDENQELKYPSHMSLDADERLIVADSENNRVILLGSDFKWNRDIIPAAEDKQQGIICNPWRLCYNEDRKQLMVGELLREGSARVHLFSLIWK